MKSRTMEVIFFSAAVSTVLSLNAVGQLSLSYTNTFETNNVDDDIANTWGWGVADAATNAAIVISSSDHTNHYSPYLPTDTPRTKVLDIAGTVSNFFVPNTPDFVYIDVCIKPQFRDSPPFDQVTPAPQVAVYVNANSNLVFYHTYWDYDTGYTGHQTWSTNDSAHILSNEWVRLTFEIAYDHYTDPAGYPANYFGDSFYRVMINGTNTFANDLSYSLENVSGNPAESSSSNRTWFMCADNTDDSQHNHKLDSFTVSGFAQMDDFYAATNNTPYQATGTSDYTTNGTPHHWLAPFVNNAPYNGDYDKADNDDTDLDGVPNWQEYWAGTNPQDSNSYFKVVSVVSNTTSFTVKWMGGTNDTNPYWVIYRTTNLLGNPSTLWTSGVPPTSVSRTNALLNSTYSRWVDTNGPTYSAKLFYKLTTTTNAPN